MGTRDYCSAAFRGPKGSPMLFPWYATTMLAFEANGVITLRLLKMSAGGQDALEEAKLMINEKVDALIEASWSIFGGATPAMVIDRYREHVGANAARLAW